MEAESWTSLVAGAGAVTGIFSLLWQLVQARRDRGRIKVHLHAAVWAPGKRTLVREESEVWPMSRDKAVTATDAIELALITVENCSKYPLSVTEVSLHLSPANGSWRRRRRLAKSLTPRSFTLEDPIFRIQRYAPNFRLEPYQQAEFLFDYWAAVELNKDPQLQHDLIVKGQSKVAGLRRPFLSPKKRQWVIPAKVVTGLGWYLKVPYSHLARRALAQVSSGSMLDEMPLEYEPDEIAPIVEAAYASGVHPVYARAESLAQGKSAHSELPYLGTAAWFRLTAPWALQEGSFTTPSEDESHSGIRRS